jgi:hypothetical protein
LKQTDHSALSIKRHAFMLEKMPKRIITHHQAAVGQLLKQSSQREISNKKSPNLCARRAERVDCANSLSFSPPAVIV